MNIKRWVRKIFESPRRREFRRETLRMWREQGARLAEQEELHIHHMYAMNPDAAHLLYGVATAEEALAKPDSVYQMFVRQSQDVWDE